MTTQTPIDPTTLLRQGDDEDETKGKGGFRKEPHWDLKEGEEAILRFLLESKEWFKARTHRFFPTKAEPADSEGKWPGFMPATCRQEPAFAALYESCPICVSGYKNKYNKGPAAEDLRYTLAIEREQYVDSETGKKAYRDKMVEIPVLDEQGKPTEEKVTVPSVVIVSQTMYMLMGSLKACGESYETLRDRDYRVKRVKNTTGNGTIYQVFPLDRDNEILPERKEGNETLPATEHWEWYELAVKAFGLSLPHLIYNKSTDDYYQRFFLEEDGFAAVDVRRETGELSPASKPAAGTKKTDSSPSGSAHSVPDADALAAMRARISKQG